jgi:hypothetical protein
LPDVVSTVAGLCGNRDLEDSTRKMAAQFLLSLAEHGQGMIRKASYFVHTLVPVAHAFLLEVDDDSDWFKAEDEMQLDQVCTRFSRPLSSVCGDSMMGVSPDE